MVTIAKILNEMNAVKLAFSLVFLKDENLKVQKGAIVYEYCQVSKNIEKVVVQTLFSLYCHAAIKCNLCIAVIETIKSKQ